jgi:diguanylate cyclase (GGDEF)-like protein
MEGHSMKNNAKQNNAGRSLRQSVDQRWSPRHSLPRTHSFYLLGLGLALAAPLGLPVVEALVAGELPTLSAAAKDLASYPVTYVYLMLSTLIAVLAVGLLLGSKLDRAHRLSITDPLTGLYNRRHFGERLTEELKRGRRYRHPTAVLSLDLDRLKELNDRFGHRTGDHALVAVSRSLSKSLRTTDVVARVGGDEFAALLPETTAHQAQALAWRIVEDVARQHELVGAPPLAASIGIVAVDAYELAEPSEVLAAADKALYQAKAAGGGKTALVRLPVAEAHEHHSPQKSSIRGQLSLPWRHHAPSLHAGDGSAA